MKKQESVKQPRKDISDSFLHFCCLRFCRYSGTNLLTKMKLVVLTIIVVAFTIVGCEADDLDLPDDDQTHSTSVSEQKILEYNEAVKNYNIAADEYNQIRGLTSLENVDNLPDICELKIYLDERSADSISENILSQDTLQIQQETADLKDALGLAHAAFDQKISEYNEAVQNYNTVVDEYKKIREITSLENIAGLPETKEPKECLEKNIEVSDFIKNGISQDAALQSIEQITQETKNLLYVLILAQQITDPDKEWVIDRLKSVDSIIKAQAVTERSDPNQLLNVDGGYTSCVYFSVYGINQNSIRGTSIIDKGTDAGGAIEVYKTVMDAQNRCEYLGQFDDTLLYSGSYAIIGTMVIRTSYLLTNEQQVELTNKITTAFTALK